MAMDKKGEQRDLKSHSVDTFRGKMKRDKAFLTKVVIRRLPSTMTEEQFLEQISPISANDYFHFVKADMSLGQFAFSRAYINFLNQDDIYLFKEKFDGYVFLDTKGNEYPAIVEFAPFQKIPKKRNKKRDAKCGTILNDPDYLNFLESLKNTDDTPSQNAEVYLEEIESREKELRANNGVPKVTTPLIEYLKQKKIEQQKIREEKREERKRKEIEKKRQREEEKRRKKIEKDKVKDKYKEKDSQSEKETVEEVDEQPVAEDVKLSDPIVQVLKNPEREKEHFPPQKSKEYFMSGRMNRDRGRREWVPDHTKTIDKTRGKERTKSNNFPVTTWESDRSCKEYKYPKTCVKDSSERNKHHKECSDDQNYIKSYTSNAIDETTFKEEEKEDDWMRKSRRDNSCPGNVESSGSVNQSREDTCKNFSASSKTLNQVATSELNDSSKSDSNISDYRDQSKDPRVERRIRNKDRPSLEIYRPGMRRFSAQRSSPQKEICTSTSNSSTPSPSPTPPFTSSSKTKNKETERNQKEKSPGEKDFCAKKIETV